MRRIRIEAEVVVDRMEENGKEEGWNLEGVSAWFEEAMREEYGERVEELIVRDLGEVTESEKPG